MKENNKGKKDIDYFLSTIGVALIGVGILSFYSNFETIKNLGTESLLLTPERAIILPIILDVFYVVIHAGYYWLSSKNMETGKVGLVMYSVAILSGLFAIADAPLAFTFAKTSSENYIAFLGVMSRLVPPASLTISVLMYSHMKSMARKEETSVGKIETNENLVKINEQLRAQNNNLKQNLDSLSLTNNSLNGQVNTLSPYAGLLSEDTKEVVQTIRANWPNLNQKTIAQMCDRSEGLVSKILNSNGVLNGHSK